MAKLRFLLLIASILQLHFHSLGQYSRQQADNLVLNQILASDTGYINVYASYDSIPDTSNIILLNGQTISLPYPYNWVFFSDDIPLANWCHPCRYIFVNSKTGNFTIDSSIFYPIDLHTNYEEILMKIAPSNDTNYSGPNLPSHSRTINPHLYAVLINGVNTINDGNGYCNYDYDIAVIYNALKEAGYDKKNIKTIFGNGNGYTAFAGDFDGTPPFPYPTVNEIDAPAYWSNLDTTFIGLTNRLVPEDQLFVYITSVGLPNSFQLYGQGGVAENYTTDNLKNAVHNINCAQMIFLMQQSYSGCFIQPLITDFTAACQNRIVQTAAGSTSSSHLQFYMQNGSGGGNIDEFTFYWAAAIRGYYEGRWPWQWSYPVSSFPFSSFSWGSGITHPSDYNPDNGDPSSYVGPPAAWHGNNDGYTQLIEAFHYADCMDTWSHNGFYDPYTSGDYETPMMDENKGFTVDTLYCINGIAGKTSTVSGTQHVLGRRYLLGGLLDVRSDMKIDMNAKLFMGVDNSIIDDKQGVNFTVDPSVTFTGYSSAPYPNGLLIENSDNILDLDNTTFNNAYLQNSGSQLTIDNNSTFNNCPIIASSRGMVNVSGSTFTNSSLMLEDQDISSGNQVSVSGCYFYLSN